MKVAELQGAFLDYWAGKADKAIGLSLNEDYCYYRKNENSRIEIYSPSTDWSQGGPLIQRELRSINNYENEKNAEGIWMSEGAYKCQLKGMGFVGEGKTILEAACRCYVGEKYGDEVPDEETKA